jgi:hypothetical protein
VGVIVGFVVVMLVAMYFTYLSHRATAVSKLSDGQSMDPGSLSARSA